jgi:hypothetical protein
MKTSATHIPEIQSIQTTAQFGQTISGGFALLFNGFSTTIIPHDVSAKLLKTIIEQNLNLANKLNRGVNADGSEVVAGVGNVTVTRSTSDSTEGYGCFFYHKLIKPNALYIEATLGKLHSTLQ